MKKIFNMKIREKKIKNPPVLLFLREKMQGSWVQSQMGTKLLKDSNGYKYRVNRINADDTMYYRCVKRASLKCSPTAHVLVNSDPPTISRLTGVNSVTDNSSRNRRRSEQRADLKKLCQSFEAMSARSYMDSIIPFLSQG